MKKPGPAKKKKKPRKPLPFEIENRDPQNLITR